MFVYGLWKTSAGGGYHGKADSSEDGGSEGGASEQRFLWSFPVLGRVNYSARWAVLMIAEARGGVLGDSLFDSVDFYIFRFFMIKNLGPYM